MARIPDAFIDDLLARTDLVEIIGARIALRRQGKEYSARCPFHDERSPSFTVSPVKQFYHCFGCGAHGTAISFLMNYDRLEFLDAVEELARRIGVEVPRETFKRNANPDSLDLYATLDAATRFFRQQLAGSAKAQAYLDRRGVSADIREKFAIGYAPDGFNALRDALGTDPRRLQLLERAGLFSKNDNGRVYDKFRDRVMFPIFDRRGRPIAFGGRVLEKDASPKYLNSPETALFHKGRELYGLWQVRQAHNRIPRLIVVEGYMDVVALFEAGFDTAVATLGTATTPDHAELLFRNAPDVYFCFDGDRAGRGAAWKAVESVLPRMKDGRQAFFLFLPEGEDPDSLIRSAGAPAFEEQLQRALPLSEFIFNQLSKEINTGTVDGKARLAERAKQYVAAIPDGAFRDRMQLLLDQKTSAYKETNADLTDAVRQISAALTKEAAELARGILPSRYVVRVPTARSAPPPTPKRSLVRSAIALLLQQPSLAMALPEHVAFATLEQPGAALLLDLIDVIRARPDIGTGALIEQFDGREEYAALQKLASQSLPGDAAKWAQEFADVCEQLTDLTRQQRVDALNRRIAESGLSSLSAEEKNELRGLQMHRKPRS